MTGQTPGSLWSEPESAHVARRPIKGINEALYLYNRDFRVVRTHRGGMGEVFICETKSEAASEKHRFALKTFQKRFFFDFFVRAAFLQEATTWARLTGCLHVMPALGLITFDERPCVRMMALEHSENVPVTVREMLQNGAVPPEDVLAVALQTALGMREATRRVPGLIHGDLKPDNLLLTPNNVWISDFGLARVFNPDRPGLPLQSTFCYQAPEVFDDPAATTPSADIYAFGLMLYELLTGRRAIEVLDRDASAEAHRRLRLPELLPGRRLSGLFLGQSEDLACALNRLAIGCAANSPQDRPSDFSEVLDALHEIAGEYDLIGQMDRLIVWRNQQLFLEDIRRRAAPDLVDALFNLEEPKLALDLIEDIGTADLSPRLLHMKGTALSLLRREHEALTCLDQVLRNPQLSEAQRLSTMIERALALKRLERFDEAIAIFESLLQSADDEDLPRIVTNLATVHLVANDNIAAVRLLRPFCASHPREALAWLNLGLALAHLNEAEQALEALDKAIALNPSLGSAHVARAAVLMDLMSRPDLAYVNLDTAFDQGFESREWLVRIVTAALAIGRERQAKLMMASARKNLGDALADKIIGEIRELIADLKDNEPWGEPRSRYFLRRPRPKDSEAKPEDKGEESSGEGRPNAVGAANPARPRQTRGLRTPFMTTRVYEPEATYSLDFYYSLGADDYAKQFRRLHRDIQQQIPQSICGYHPHLRTSPFYVTVCPGCRVEILTNRDIGKAIRCQRCEAEHDCEPVVSTEATQVIAHVDEMLGRSKPDAGRQYVGIAFQTQSAEQDETLTSICREAGFRPLPAGSQVLTLLQADGYQRGTFDRKKLVLGFMSAQSLAGDPAARALPPSVDLLVRRLRQVMPALRSLSASFDERDPRLEFDLSPERLGRRIAELERRLAASEDFDVLDLDALVELLRMTGRHAEAVMHARKLVSLRPEEARYRGTLGALEFRLGNIEAAIEAFTRALEINPRDAVHMCFLAKVHEAAGDMPSARLWSSRSDALGGPENTLEQQHRT